MYCTVFITAIISLRNINKSVYKPRRSVYCAVCNASLQATREYRQSGSLAPIIFYLGAIWRWVVSITPRPLDPTRERPPIQGRLVGFRAGL